MIPTDAGARVENVIFFPPLLFLSLTLQISPLLFKKSFQAPLFWRSRQGETAEVSTDQMM